jgi:UDP-N-acetylmuramoyl-tripeptide--D-alanyl-D-alanine ligase
MMMRLWNVASALGVSREGLPDVPVARVCTDTRSLEAGELFVALSGPHFDGHDFVECALQKGACAAVVRTAYKAKKPVGLPLIGVEDPRKALGHLGTFWRSRFRLPLIGITGSNGKTTVKEMCAAILQAQAQQDGLDPKTVLATHGNLNNDIGVPRMLLELNASHRYAVIEMGMNHPGEIALLARMAAPTVAVVNNAQRAHLEGLGGVEAIAREKGGIYEGLAHDGVAVLNADDPFFSFWSQRLSDQKRVSFGLTEQADVRAECTLTAQGTRMALFSPWGPLPVTLQVPGLHNVRNALAASAACLSAGASLQAVFRGLSFFEGTPGRLQRKITRQGASLLDDSYNANPDSVRAGIDVLASHTGHTVLVLGDMGEIGEQSARLHDEVGGYARSAGVDELYGFGLQSEVAARSFGSRGRHFATIEALIEALEKTIGQNSVVLVKGSRFMKMERVCQALCDFPKEPASHVA